MTYEDVKRVIAAVRLGPRVHARPECRAEKENNRLHELALRALLPELLGCDLLRLGLLRLADLKGEA